MGLPPAAHIYAVAGPWWAIVLAFIAFAFAICFWVLAEELHDTQFCQQCVNSWPTNPSEVAERRWRWLWWRHFGFFASVALLLTFYVAFSWFGLPGPTNIMLWAGVYASQGKARRLHDQLSPWCKWCRRGRGDDGDRDVEPTPTPSQELA